MVLDELPAGAAPTVATKILKRLVREGMLTPGDVVLRDARQLGLGVLVDGKPVEANRVHLVRPALAGDVEAPNAYVQCRECGTALPIATTSATEPCPNCGKDALMAVVPIEHRAPGDPVVHDVTDTGFDADELPAADAERRVSAAGASRARVREGGVPLIELSEEARKARREERRSVFLRAFGDACSPRTIPTRYIDAVLDALDEYEERFPPMRVYEVDVEATVDVAPASVEEVRASLGRQVKAAMPDVDTDGPVVGPMLDSMAAQLGQLVPPSIEAAAGMIELRVEAAGLSLSEETDVQFDAGIDHLKYFAEGQRFFVAVEVVERGEGRMVVRPRGVAPVEPG